MMLEELPRQKEAMSASQVMTRRKLTMLSQSDFGVGAGKGVSSILNFTRVWSASATRIS